MDYESAGAACLHRIRSNSIACARSTARPVRRYRRKKGTGVGEDEHDDGSRVHMVEMLATALLRLVLYISNVIQPSRSISNGT